MIMMEMELSFVLAVVNKFKKGDMTMTWLKNFLHIHERLMCYFLRKRNWVVFYLEPQNRICNEDCCWLKLYKSINGRV